MIATTDLERVGWGCPLLSTRFHFFHGNTSLCGRAFYTGKLYARVPGGPRLRCVPCVRKRARR